MNILEGELLNFARKKIIPNLISSFTEVVFAGSHAWRFVNVLFFYNSDLPLIKEVVPKFIPEIQSIESENRLLTGLKALFSGIKMTG